MVNLPLDKDDVQHRHDTISNYIKNRMWDMHPEGKKIEFELVREVVENLSKRRPELEEYKYIYNYEWEVIPGETDKGKGDLVFTDGVNKFLIIECKTKDSNDVRNQVVTRIEQFKEINAQTELLFICGLAVSPQSWDYLNEQGEWDYETSEEDKLYLQLYTNLQLTQEQIEIKKQYQDFYQKKGYKPKDPLSALNEMSQAIFLEGDLSKQPQSNKPPFLIHLEVSLLDKVPGKIIQGSGIDRNSKIAKALAAANICEQIFLPYSLKSVYIKINKIDRSGPIWKLLPGSLGNLKLLE